jgi:hypothetical protein
MINAVYRITFLGWLLALIFRVEALAKREEGMIGVPHERIIK